MAKSIALAADASRLASLLLSYIRAVCAFVAPRHPGASAAIIDRLSHFQALPSVRGGRRERMQKWRARHTRFSLPLLPSGPGGVQAALSADPCIVCTTKALLRSSVGARKTLFSASVSARNRDVGRRTQIFSQGGREDGRTSRGEKFWVSNRETTRKDCAVSARWWAARTTKTSRPPVLPVKKSGSSGRRYDSGRRLRPTKRLASTER